MAAVFAFATICSAVHVLFLIFCIYSLKQFYGVKDQFIFKKRHSALTIILCIAIMVNMLNGMIMFLLNDIFIHIIKFSLTYFILYQQYMSFFMIILYAVVLKVWMNYFDINYSQTIINNEWKSLIDETIGDGKVNWFIKHKNSFGSSKYWIKCIFLIYAISLFVIYLLEGIYCWNSLDFNKCYYYIDSFESFKYRQKVANYENYVTVCFALIAWTLVIMIRYKTSSFEDNFHVKQEIQYLLYCSIAIIFNIPHAFICYCIEHKKYNLLGTDNSNNIINIERISAILTVTQYNAFAVFGVYITTIWTIQKNKDWLKLFQKSHNKHDNLLELNARASLRLDPLHKKTEDLTLTTYNLAHIHDEQVINDRSISTSGAHNTTSDIILRRTTTEQTATASQTDQSHTIELDQILGEEDWFNSFMFHLSTEFSIEIIISLIEFSQFKYYIQTKILKHQFVVANNDKIEQILKIANKMIPKSYIVNSNNFENGEFAIKYKSEYALYIGMVYKKNAELKEYDDAKTYQLLFESLIMSYQLFNKYISIESLAEININYASRQELIDIFDDMNVEQFITKTINDKLINGDSNIIQQIQFFYRIFDDCCEQMKQLMAYSFDRFKATTLFKKLIHKKI